MAEEREYWTIPQLAKLWGVGRNTVNHLIDTKRLKAFWIVMPSGHVHFRIKDEERRRFEDRSVR